MSISPLRVASAIVRVVMLLAMLAGLVAAAGLAVLLARPDGRMATLWLCCTIAFVGFALGVKAERRSGRE